MTMCAALSMIRAKAKFKFRALPCAASLKKVVKQSDMCRLFISSYDNPPTASSFVPSDTVYAGFTSFVDTQVCAISAACGEGKVFYPIVRPNTVSVVNL